VTHLKFDESSGTKASNSGSDSHTATLYDDYGEPNEEPTGAEGQIGKAILMNGPDSEAYAFGVLDNYSKITEEGTVSVWLNTPGMDGESAVILRNGANDELNAATANPNQFQIGLANNADGEPALVAAITAGPNLVRIVDTEAITLDEWNHVALTADGGQLRLYKNGNLVGVADYHYLDRIGGSTEGWVAIGANISLITEGEYSYFAMNEANPESFSGSMDDLAIWHVARSAEDIQSIYKKGLGGEDVSKASVTIPVFVEPGTVEPEISVVHNVDGTVTVTYTGKLQSAPSVNGPWEDVVGESPLTLQPDQPARFARAISE